MLTIYLLPVWLHLKHVWLEVNHPIILKMIERRLIDTYDKVTQFLNKDNSVGVYEKLLDPSIIQLESEFEELEAIQMMHFYNKMDIDFTYTQYQRHINEIIEEHRNEKLKNLKPSKLKFIKA